MADPIKLRKLAEFLREEDRRSQEIQVKQAALVLKAVKGLHILAKLSEETAR